MLKHVAGLIFACSVLALTGCATVFSGVHQSITLQTEPPGARCEVVREGRVIASVETTPGVVNIEKTKYDMNVWCKKDGFVESKGAAQSGNEGATLGNIVIGGLVGWGVDSALGADNKYPEQVTVNLLPNDRYTATADKLEVLKKAHEKGLLSDQEYMTKRKLLVKQL